MSDEMRRVMDEAAIRRVIDRYCHAVDRGSADDVAALFHPNGRLVVSLEDNDGYNGREAVREWYANYHKYFRARLTHLRHKISNIQIDLNGDEARVVSYMDADLIAKDETTPRQAIGRYDDRFVRDGGEWYFAERTIVVYYADERLAELLSADS